jgi:hypothetical protein
MITRGNVCGKQVVWYGIERGRDLTLPFTTPTLF